jgi:cell division protein FtsZ
VGTVIDPQLSDELRVTVVATGLGQPQAAVMTPARSAPMANAMAPARAMIEPATRVRRPVVVPSDYAKLDEPAVQRLKTAVGDGFRPEPEPVEDILDIPAFLRRQAD